MISKNKTLSLTAIYIFVALWVAGCASFQSGPDIPESTKLMQEGMQALNDGQKEKGACSPRCGCIAQIPARPTLGQKLPRHKFDAENYPAAIVAADEAQKRDPNRKETKAISVVASLRVAVRALTDMREDANLRGSTRAEAERLARMLRETLGQDVLVPMPAPEEPRSRRAAPAAVTPPAAAPAPGAPPAPETRGNTKKSNEHVPPKHAAGQSSSAPAAGGDTNPFSVLK